mgnify:CR=1 FL=1
MGLTTDKNDPCLNKQRPDGQNECYLVLSEEERQKGFVRPFRNKYTHVGRKIELDGGTIELLSEEEAKRFGTHIKYTHFLRYPESKSPLVGKALTQEEVDNIGKYIGGCGAETRMGDALSETYARDPKFYGATYCVGCKTHLPVNEFIWSDGEILGS